MVYFWSTRLAVASGSAERSERCRWADGTRARSDPMAIRSAHKIYPGISRRRTDVKARKLDLPISPSSFGGLWISIFLIRVVSFVYLVFVSTLCIFLHEPNMTYTASLLGPDAIAQLKPMGVCAAALAIAHAYKVLNMLRCSWRSGKFVFEGVQRREYSSKANAEPDLTVPLGNQPKSRRHCSKACASILVSMSSMWRECFGRYGFFGVKSEYFEIQHTIREVTEILAQTLQLYTATNLMTKFWITDLHCIIVVINCWSTPIVQYLCRRKLWQVEYRASMVSINGQAELEGIAQGIIALERFLCLAIDLCLDITTVVVIPGIILFPYIWSFDYKLQAFPPLLLYDDVWYVNLVFELQQVLPVNTLELVLIMFQFWSIFSCCNSLHALVQRKANSSGNDKPPGDNLTRGSRRASSQFVVPYKRNSVRVQGRIERSLSKSLLLSLEAKRLHTYLMKASTSSTLRTLFFLWGLLISALHIMAIASSITPESARPPPCKQMLRPWFGVGCACSVIDYNCFVAGATTVTDDDLKDINPTTLAVLIFSHCSALVVPPAIHNFRNLLGLDIYNSTIERWDRSAELSVSHHKRLAYVQILRSNMSMVPEGMMTALPANLQDIEFVECNLTTLPDSLDSHWHSVSVLIIENCLFTEVPPVLMRLQFDELSLLGNKIITLDPPWKLPVTSLSTGLSLSLNPLREIPMHPLVDDFSTMSYISLEGTEITTLPEWFLDAKSRFRVYLNGSEFCRQLDHESLTHRFGSAARITCIDLDYRGTGFVPIEYLASHRPLIPQLPH